MGCYVGEVLVRQARALWTVQEETQNVFGSPLVLRVGNAQASPITRCFKRMKDDSDGVEAWGRVLVAVGSGNFREEATGREGGEKVNWQTEGF